LVCSSSAMNILWSLFLISVLSAEGIDLRCPHCFCGRLIWLQPFSTRHYLSTILISPRMFFLSVCAFFFKYISLMVLWVTRPVHRVFS
jgi:hypothetical protein